MRVPDGVRQLGEPGPLSLLESVEPLLQEPLLLQNLVLLGDEGQVSVFPAVSLLKLGVEGLDLGLDVVDGKLSFSPFVLSKNELPFSLEPKESCLSYYRKASMADITEKN